jgi:hypothetical protein
MSVWRFLFALLRQNFAFDQGEIKKTTNLYHSDSEQYTTLI